MSIKRRKDQIEKDITSRYLSGDLDDDELDGVQRFAPRSAGTQQARMEKTALLRAAEELVSGDIESLPTGQVAQVYSLFYDVESAAGPRLCVLRKTLAKLSDTPVVAGDFVKFRETGGTDEQGRPEAVIEQILPRKTVLTRSDSFKGIEQQPIVANADQMLIVVSLHEPAVKWGLVDRMLVAAQGGGLRPIICLNKADLFHTDQELSTDEKLARDAMAHYRVLGFTALQTSVPRRFGLDELRGVLKDKTTVLAGHSGVGKSSLIRSIQPQLDPRIGAISGYTGKGRHTTTSARRYVLDFGGVVVDTPGVKLFGLWAVTRENLLQNFPDVADDSAPLWRRESYYRILESLPPET